MSICLVHAIPTWYANLIPVPPGTATPLPPWSIESHLAFMAANGKTLRLDLNLLVLKSRRLDISHDVISISTPGSQIFPNNAAYSTGLARLLNEVGCSR